MENDLGDLPAAAPLGHKGPLLLGKVARDVQHVHWIGKLGMLDISYHMNRHGLRFHLNQGHLACLGRRDLKDPRMIAHGQFHLSFPRDLERTRGQQHFKLLVAQNLAR